jgi:uncharacterized protein involved in outer membrane biogenesis
MYRKTATVLLIVIGIVYGSYLSLNFGLRKVIESRLTHSLGLKIKIGSFRMYPWRSKIAVEKFSIANPEGFSHQAIFTLKECTAFVDFSTLTHDIIVVDELKLRGIDINVDHNKDAVNLDSLKHTVKQHESSTAVSDAAAPSGEKSAAPKKRFRINRLKAKDIEVSFASASMGLKAIHFKIPDAVINDLAQTSGEALTVDEILYELIRAVIDKLAAQGPENYQKEIKKFLSDQLENYYKK